MPKYPSWGNTAYLPTCFDRMKKISKRNDIDVYYNSATEHVVVVKSGNKVTKRNTIAFASFDILGGNCNILNVYVSPKFRKRGIGMFIYKSMLKTGHTLASITTLNPDSVKLWNKLVQDSTIATWAVNNDYVMDINYELHVVNGKPEPKNCDLTFDDVHLFAKQRI